MFVKYPNLVSMLGSAFCLSAALAWASFASAGAGEGEDHLQHAPAGATVVDAVRSGGKEQEMSGDQGMRCGGEEHANHRAMMAKKGYQRSEHAYPLNDYRLVSMDGEETSLLKELDTDRPVMLNFIFTTCPTICPLMSGVFSQVQQELGPASGEVRMISISIDPEYDTPERLRAYAQRFRAGPQWQFLTGDPADIVAVQKAFDVYRGNKMGHEPATLLRRRSRNDPWVRLDGIASAGEIVAEYRNLVGR
jgi:protein SCO1